MSNSKRNTCSEKNEDGVVEWKIEIKKKKKTPNNKKHRKIKRFPKF